MPSKIVESKPLNNKRILIVEDDSFISRIYSKWLTAAGATVITANDGAQCLRILAEDPTDVVLLDLGMPGLNGYETLTQLRMNPALKTLPVIILSNTTMKENKEGFEEIRKAGVTNVLRKYETSLTEIVDCILSYFPEDAQKQTT
jgi:CheY-like chemotaxis protein